MRSDRQELDEPVELTLAQQHGVPQPLREAAKEPLGKRAELEALGAGLPQQAAGGLVRGLPYREVLFPAVKDLLQNQGTK